MPKPAQYHPEDIKAMIHKRGSTLGQISLEAGLCMQAGSCGLRHPLPAANRAISGFLGIPMHRLWPDWYDQYGNRRCVGLKQAHSLPRSSSRVESICRT